ncbi:hypothetical protein MTR_2g084365 [Medicago truncatula]|uniref:Uncharacterized protein n=1 Tax=Medicago truncatula TaxID=3880 RepID=A0A072VL91_MEDTR|nr:hypothetical protein MTR_2g084365 [Medicago truncatula]
MVVPKSSNTNMVRETSATNMIPKALNNGMKQSASRGKSRGKITRKKDVRLHKLVFEEDVLPDGAEVSYYSHGKVTKRDMEFFVPVAMQWLVLLSLNLTLDGHLDASRCICLV